MKINKSILGLIGFSVAGLGLAVTLPLALSSCNGGTSAPAPENGKPVIPQSPNISVKISDAKQEDGSINLTAKATNTNSEETKFGYQWYFKPISNKFYNSFATLSSRTNVSTEGWSPIDNATSQTLKIESKYVVPGLSGYEFMCQAYNTANQAEGNISNSLNITGIPKKDITLSLDALTNLMNNFTTKLSVGDVQKMVIGSVTGINQWVECKPEIIEVIAQNLFGNDINKTLVNPIKSVEVALGTNWLIGEFGFEQFVSLDFKITLNGTNYDLTNKGDITNTIGKNTVSLSPNGSVVTVSHLQTGISVGSVASYLKGQFSLIINAIKTAGLTTHTGLIALTNETLPIYQAIANYFGIPLAAVLSVNVSAPVTNWNNKMSLLVQVKGYNLETASNDHGSGCSMQPNGFTQAYFDLTIPK